MMSPLIITWEYLTGYSVATSPIDRDAAEWPPHPARIFMALAAAWFETEPADGTRSGLDSWKAEGAALRWLETLGDPEMLLPSIGPGSERANVTVYVPVNDRSGPSGATLQSCPALTRNKQPRTFPRTWIGDGSCILRWSDVDGLAEHREPLDRLCRKVTRIGHSSSLVSMRVSDELEEEPEESEHFVADDLHSDFRVRSLSRGTLDSLHEKFGAESRDVHASLGRSIETLKAEMPRGKEAAKHKERMNQLEADRDNFVPRSPVRPTIGLWSGYRRSRLDNPSPEVARSHFDDDLLILSHVGGPSLPAVSTLAVTKALRDTIISLGPQPVPPWVSGHSPDGRPLRTGEGHLALVPLPFVGHGHADGHLLGAALVFPRSISPRERGSFLGEIVMEEDGRPKTVRLTLGPLGVWELRKKDWQEPRLSLQAETWTRSNGPTGATTWASVTPVVLDRFPKADRLDPAHRHDWEAEVRRIIGEACTRIDLPEPEVIEVGTTSWHLGSPRAIGKRRPLRGHPDPIGKDASLGDGFPSFPAKGTKAPRPQVHVRLHFARPVIGPVLIGAGRYFGYGFCKPLKEDRA